MFFNCLIVSFGIQFIFMVFQAETTKKIPMTSVRNIFDEPIEGHGGYSIVGFQTGTTYVVLFSFVNTSIMHLFLVEKILSYGSIGVHHNMLCRFVEKSFRVTEKQSFLIWLVFSLIRFLLFFLSFYFLLNINFNL